MTAATGAFLQLMLLYARTRTRLVFVNIWRESTRTCCGTIQYK